MSSVFTKIVNHEIPCYEIAQNDDFLAFLDINPLTKGHTLVIPKIEIDYYFDIEDDLMERYSVFTKRVAEAIKKSIPCERVGVAVMGLEVPHAHIHLIPFYTMDEMNFANPKLDFSNEEFLQISKSIKEQFSF